MASLISLFVVLSLSLLIVRIATTALTITGVSRELARFQARSAFTGVGFTTSEAEAMMSHPARRRIVMALMLLGNAGVVTAVSSLLLSFVDVEGAQALKRLLWVVGGVAALWAFAMNDWAEERMHRAVRWIIERSARVDVVDYVNLLRVSKDYSVREMKVEKGDWMAGRSLRDLALSNEGVIVLGIVREGEDDYLGAPTPETKLYEGDTVIMYGRDESLQDLDDRRAGSEGEAAHTRGVERHDRETAKQADRDSERERSRTTASN